MCLSTGCSWRSHLSNKMKIITDLRREIRIILEKLWQTPLLLGWLIVGPGIAWLLRGTPGLVEGVINLVLLAFWVLLIRWLTPAAPPPRPLRRPGLECWVALGLLALLFAVQLLDFDVVQVNPLHRWVHTLTGGLYNAVYGLAAVGVPQWALQDLFLAASSTMKQLLPTMLAIWGLGYGWRDLGLRAGVWRLTAVLLLLTMLLGLGSGTLWRAPLPQVLARYVIGLFVNGLPEELFFRGLLLPRWEALLGNALHALVVSAWFFNAIHIPIELANGASWPVALAQVFSIGFPSGLLWGYLYLRTRSIVPGVFWHTAQMNLGYLLVSLS